MDKLLSAVDARFEENLQALEAFIRIPSVSSPSFDQSTLEDSAAWVAAQLAEAGLEPTVSRGKNPDGTPGRPAVTASLPAAPGKPTVLLYAHHDVQPGGDPATWTTPGGPFEPHRRDGRLFGRGSADDGAGLLAHVGALKALRDVYGAHGIGIRIFFEGEEESGSPSFEDFLATHREELSADVIVVADSSNWTTEIPSLTTSLRGVVDCEVELRVASGAMHSGMYGGPILDAVTLMARLIATLHDEKGDVAVPGLVVKNESDVDYVEADLREATGVVDSYQLAGTGTLAARIWTKPAISVIGLDATSVANASNTIAPVCRAVISMRVAPGQDTQAAMDALTTHLIDNAPFGAQVTVKPGDQGPAFDASACAGKAGEVKRWALEQAFGHAPVDTGIGGSIPFISTFAEVYPDAEILVTGVEDPYSKAHSEDESVDIESLRKVIGAEALFLARLGSLL